MKFSKFLTHPILVMLTVIAFSFLVTGCERTVTKYDANHKPYTAKEFDPWMTIGGIILTCLVIGALAAAAADSGSGGSSYIYERRPLYARAVNKNVMSDVSVGLSAYGKWILVVDANDKLISKHLIQLNRSQLAQKTLSLSDVQLSSKINEEALKDLMRDIAKTSKLKQIPESIRANVSFLHDEPNALKINTVSLPEIEANSDGKISEFILTSLHGIYRITSVPDKDSKGVSITVSQLGQE